MPPLDTLVGNVRFADLPLTHHGKMFTLQDGFLYKIIDALAPGGPAVTLMATAEGGLLMSLDCRVKVDLSFVAELFGRPEDRVFAELGDLICRDRTA